MKEIVITQEIRFWKKHELPQISVSTAWSKIVKKSGCINPCLNDVSLRWPYFYEPTGGFKQRAPEVRFKFHIVQKVWNL